VNGLVVSPDSRVLYSASADATVRQWSLDTGEVRRVAHVAGPRASAEGFMRFTQPLRTMAGHKGSVNGVAVAPNGRFVFSGGADRSLRQWDASTGEA
jgi:WD40 repeat protein